jgi:hypothetical protein
MVISRDELLAKDSGDERWSWVNSGIVFQRARARTTTKARGRTTTKATQRSTAPHQPKDG